MSGIILNSVAGLGLILIIMGVIASFMFIFGIGKVRVGGKNKLQYKIRGTAVQVETGHVYFAIVLGLILAITPFPISKYFGELGKFTVRDEATPTTYKLEESEYTILEEDIRVDLRKGKEIGIRGYLGGELSGTERLILIVIKDVGPGIEKVSFPYSTSLSGIEVVDKPKGGEWTKTRKKEEVEYNPFVGLIKRKEFFKDLLARKGEMKSYHMTVPVMEGPGQQIIYKLKYYNAFQGRDFEWAGKFFSTDTDILNMHITFPEDKPFKSFETYKRDPSAKELIQINNPEIETLLGNHILTWTIRDAKKGEIRDAKKGEKYYIKWFW